MKNYCPECGSEVAPIDVFCHYCGIALTPVSTGDISKTDLVTEEKVETVAVPKVDESLVNPEPLDIPFENPIPATPYVLTDEFQPPVAHLDELLNQKPVSMEVAPESTEFEMDLPEEVNSKTLPDASEIPSPTKAEPFEATEDLELDFTKASDASSGQISSFSEVPDSIETLGDTPETIEATDPKIDQTDEPDFEATIPYVPEDFMRNELQFSKSEANALDKLTEYKDEVRDTDEAIPQSEPEICVLPEVDENFEPTSESPDLVLAGLSAKGISDNAVEEKFESPVVESKGVEIDEMPISTELSENSNQNEVVENEAALEPEAAEPVEHRPFTNPIGSNMSASADTDGKNKTKLKPLDEGTVLNNRYEIIRKIGGGGMGAVYLASDKNLGGILRAVKEMVQSYIEEAQQEKAIADFKRESLLLTTFDHASIPTIFDYFYDEKEARFYLVMKYISGGDLSGRMRATQEGRLDEVTVTDLAIQIADVLEYLHRHDPPIVYRDLKPSNIMIDGNSGKAMLIDFGIARWVNKEEKGVTAVGTMGYAPPELFSGNVEPRSDIYSLGSTMFHLLTGADPQSNPLLIFDFNKNPRPRQINSQLSDQMEQILMRAVEYNTSQRFGSAAEMREALSNHLESLKRGTVTFGVSVPSPGMPLTGSLPVFCGFCGQKILATDVFCPFCGAQQPLAAAGQSQNLRSPSAFSPAKTFARLMLIGTSDLDNTEFSLEKDNNLVGRRDPMSNIFPEVDLSKYDPQTKISRKHARIWRENDVFMVEDLGSSNGTSIISASSSPNRLLPRQPHVLAHGDKIRVGDTTLQFSIG